MCTLYCILVICLNFGYGQYQPNALINFYFYYEEARINSFWCVAIYVHDSFSFTRLDSDTFKQSSTVYESMFLEIYNNGEILISSSLVVFIEDHLN